MKTGQMFTTAAGLLLLSGTMVYAQQGEFRQPGPGMDDNEGAPEVRREAPPMRDGAPGGEGRRMGRPNDGARFSPGGGFGGERCPMMGSSEGRGREGGNAQGPRMRRDGSGPTGGRGLIPDPMRAKEAGATDEQIEALKTLAFEQETKRVDLQAAVEKADLALDYLMKSATVDEKAAVKAADAVAQARGELFKQEIATRVKVKSVLGDEVLKKLREPSAPQGACPAMGGQPSGTPGAQPQAQGRAAARIPHPAKPGAVPAPAAAGQEQ